MNRDELLAYLEINLERWPKKGAGTNRLPELPKGCEWQKGGATGRWIAWPVRGKDGRGMGIGENDWSASIKHYFSEERADAIGQNGPTGDHYDTQMVYCDCGDKYPATSYGAGFIDGAGMCEGCMAEKGSAEALESLAVYASPRDIRARPGLEDFARPADNTMTPEEEELPAQEKHDCPRCGGCFYSPPHEECPCQPDATTADGILAAARQHMLDRASTYDKPEGERSMNSTVLAFAAVTGVLMTEEQGWLFMQLLKAVRSQQGDYRADSYEDGAAYVALAGEAAARDRKNQ